MQNKRFILDDLLKNLTITRKIWNNYNIKTFKGNGTKYYKPLIYHSLLLCVMKNFYKIWFITVFCLTMTNTFCGHMYFLHFLLIMNESNWFVCLWRWCCLSPGISALTIIVITVSCTSRAERVCTIPCVFEARPGWRTRTRLRMTHIIIPVTRETLILNPKTL